MLTVFSFVRTLISVTHAILLNAQGPKRPPHVPTQRKQVLLTCSPGRDLRSRRDDTREVDRDQPLWCHLVDCADLDQGNKSTALACAVWEREGVVLDLVR